jgi:glycosyltransferase involved in cell wall biosynthesis
VWNEWTLDVHSNGHGGKTWSIALACGIASQFGTGARLTLHSGMAPAYVRSAPEWKRRVIRLTCALYSAVVCVNAEIGNAMKELGVGEKRLQITPAFVPLQPSGVAVPQEIENWIALHSPLVTATLFFRPEYGFDLLVEAVARLQQEYPRIGCLVMGYREVAEPTTQLSDALFLAGDLNHQLCLALMARSNVFVRPTLCDGDSISVREAITLKVPVVASNVGTRPEGVFLFDAGDVNGLVKQMTAALQTRKEVFSFEGTDGMVHFQPWIND